MNAEVSSKLSKFVKDGLLKSNKPLNSMGIGTGAMIAGFVGTVTGFEFREVRGARTVRRNNDQTLRIGNEDLVIAPKGQPAVTFYVVFNHGAKITATTLLEQHPDSFIAMGDANGGDRKFSTFAGTDWYDLIGSTLRCDDASRDVERPAIQRLTGAEVDGVAQMAPQNPMKFKFTLIAKPAQVPDLIETAAGVTIAPAQGAAPVTPPPAENVATPPAADTTVPPVQ